MEKNIKRITALILMAIMLSFTVGAFAYEPCPVCNSRVKTVYSSWEDGGYQSKVENGKVYHKYRQVRNVHAYCSKNQNHLNEHWTEQKYGDWIYVWDVG